MPIIQEMHSIPEPLKNKKLWTKILEGSTIYTDSRKAYDGLILNGYDHFRIFHSANEFARGKNHVNKIEAFWSFCKRRWAKFNGFSNKKFILHLKESEFRYNHRQQDLYKSLLKLIRKKSPQRSRAYHNFFSDNLNALPNLININRLIILLLIWMLLFKNK